MLAKTKPLLLSGLSDAIGESNVSALDLAKNYKESIRIKTINMFEKFYYVLEPNRVIYLQKSSKN